MEIAIILDIACIIAIYAVNAHKVEIVSSKDRKTIKVDINSQMKTVRDLKNVATIALGYPVFASQLKSQKTVLKDDATLDSIEIENYRTSTLEINRDKWEKYLSNGGIPLKGF